MAPVERKVNQGPRCHHSTAIILTQYSEITSSKLVCVRSRHNIKEKLHKISYRIHVDQTERSGNYCGVKTTWNFDCSIFTTKKNKTEYLLEPVERNQTRGLRSSATSLTGDSKNHRSQSLLDCGPPRQHECNITKLHRIQSDQIQTLEMGSSVKKWERVDMEKWKGGGGR